MPIIHIHLAEGSADTAQERRLLRDASRLYAEILECPIDRVRVFIVPYPRGRVAVAGMPLDEGGTSAPYFEFLVLEGRPLDQRQRLLAGFSALIVDTLGIERGLVRGHCRSVRPEDWAIGGIPASELRKADIAAFTAREQA